jgi:hypothetical protein
MYTLPGPDGTVYALIFQPKCVDCCGPDVVIIQKWPSRKALEEIEFEPVPELPMYHRNYCDEAIIVTGRTHGEFIKALSHHLIGLDTANIMKYRDNKCLDNLAAEIILEDMYADATCTPRLVGDET